MDSIRYGIIGTGMMGLEHMRNIRLLEGATVSAYADPNEASRGWAEQTLGEGSGALGFEDPLDLLESGAVDAVVIASPNYTHVDVLRAVLATDLHVMVEKPLCTTTAQCRELEAAAARHSGVVWVGMEYRYMPPIARLIQEVGEGAIGRLVMIAIREHRFPFLPKVGDWNRFARNTGGTLVEKCCHFFDLMTLIVAERPVRVYASGGQDVNHLDEGYDGETPDILDNAFVTVDFASGARGLLDLCMFAEGTRNEQEIAVTGELGKLECFIPESTVRIGTRQPREVREIHVPVEKRLLEAGFHHGSTYYEHLRFLEAVRSGADPEVSFADGLRAVALGEAAERSVAERRPVDLSEFDL